MTSDVVGVLGNVGEEVAGVGEVGEVIVVVVLSGVCVVGHCDLWLLLIVVVLL